MVLKSFLEKCLPFVIYLRNLTSGQSLVSGCFLWLSPMVTYDISYGWATSWEVEEKVEVENIWEENKAEG